MTWFRVGGAGIPAALKNAMNAVFNKKFGTSGQNYPPNQWPDDVDLMGMLEEKTVSGAIAVIEDGADDVPLKSCEVALPASLDGYSSVDVVSAGKNLVDYGERSEMVRNGITSSISADGTITASGSSTGNGDMPITLSTSMFLKGGQPYTISFTGTDTRSGSVYIYFAGGGYINIPNSRSYGVYTPDSDVTITGITLRMFSGQSITMSAKMMIEAGNVSYISYEPYVAPTTYTATLGRTIYGGEVDIVNGTGTDENGNDFTFTGQEVPTRLGYNAFWSDEGDTEVTYRSSGTVTPVLPTLISKSITENGTYSAEDDNADGYAEVVVNVSGGSCERLLYLHCVNNDQVEIPAASSIAQGEKYSQYVSYDSTTKKFTVLQDFTAIIIAWVYTYQAYESSRSDGAIYINNSQVAQYEASGTAAGSTGGVYLARNFKQNDTFNVYTPTRDGYPQQNLKIYFLAAVPDNIYTFTDENA